MKEDVNENTLNSRKKCEINHNHCERTIPPEEFIFSFYHKKLSRARAGKARFKITMTGYKHTTSTPNMPPAASF